MDVTLTIPMGVGVLALVWKADVGGVMVYIYTVSGVGQAYAVGF